MDNSIRAFIFDEKYKFFRHLLFWLFIYTDELLSLVGLTEELEFPLVTVGQLLIDIITVYLILYVLIPRYLHTKQYTTFLIWVFLMIFINIHGFFLIETYYYYYEDGHLSYYISSFVTTASVLGLAMAIKLLKNQIIQTEEKQELIEEKNKVELQALKDQVNPHFLFNVLNTIYIQTKTDAGAASKSIMKLSDLLRFQIYDAAQKDWIPYEQEKSFLQNYLDLEVMRRDGLSYNWVETDSNINQYAVPTFLLLPLIENAIKHSRTSLASNEFINIEISKSKSALILRCSNNIGDIKHDDGGFGLENLKKRLGLIFSKGAPLLIEEKGGIFKVELSLPIDELHNNR